MPRCGLCNDLGLARRRALPLLDDRFEPPNLEMGRDMVAGAGLNSYPQASGQVVAFAHLGGAVFWIIMTEERTVERRVWLKPTIYMDADRTFAGAALLSSVLTHEAIRQG